ncbi:hypothetical protein FQV37_2461 [Psychrobacter nivimaris]|uniref:Uncharacterized protein n=1 Tax=Psychrobacter nivimaris TaxID=281738 RepID=A0A6N7C396_9GAMM|nr:hypothetical protein FQV37_2461 [Psychrobacter nivimaris]
MHYRNMPDEAKRKMPYCLLLHSKKANIVFNQRVNQFLAKHKYKKAQTAFIALGFILSL